MGELKHKGALNTQQFEELKHATRERGVSAETSAHLDTLGGLRCDAILNEEEYDSELGELLRSIHHCHRTRVAQQLHSCQHRSLW